MSKIQSKFKEFQNMCNYPYDSAWLWQHRTVSSKWSIACASDWRANQLSFHMHDARWTKKEFCVHEHGWITAWNPCQIAIHPNQHAVEQDGFAGQCAISYHWNEWYSHTIFCPVCTSTNSIACFYTVHLQFIIEYMEQNQQLRLVNLCNWGCIHARGSGRSAKSTT